jgi:large subunit ribosomal protein L17
MAMVELVDYNTTYNPNNKAKKKITRRGKTKKVEETVEVKTESKE